MQGTVRTFNGATASGTVLLDDGTEVAFDHRAFDRSGVRMLRFGQRVRVEFADGADAAADTVDPAGARVVALSLLTIDHR